MVAVLLLRDAAPLAFAAEGSILASSPASEGRQLYREGEYDLAADALERARGQQPDDEDAALFLGLTELRRSRPEAAARSLHDYVRLEQGSDAAEEIGRLLPIVEREANARDARAALSAEAIGGAPTIDESRVAILPFRDGGGSEAASLSRAMAKLVAGNLAAAMPQAIVPPERVFRFLEEAKVSPQGIAGPAAAARIGRLLGAGRVVAGTISSTAEEPKRLRADVLVIRSDDAAKLDTIGLERLAADGAAIVAPVAEALARSLGAGVGAGVGEEHTRSLEAFLAYGRALDRIEAGDAMEGRLELERSLAASSSFAAAREELARTPASFVSLVAVGNMIESAALSPSERGETESSNTMLYLLGAGVVAAGAAGIAIALGGGGGGGGGDDDGDPAAPSLEGVSDRTVVFGDVVSFVVVGRDPNGDDVTLTADLTDVPGATFVQTSGDPATGQFRWQPDENDLGIQRVTITATEIGPNPLSTSETAEIRVIAGVLTPTASPPALGTPMPTPTETPDPIVGP